MDVINGSGSPEVSRQEQRIGDRDHTFSLSRRLASRTSAKASVANQSDIDRVPAHLTGRFNDELLARPDV